jgi:hypothetical protein
MPQAQQQARQHQGNGIGDMESSHPDGNCSGDDKEQDENRGVIHGSELELLKSGASFRYPSIYNNDQTPAFQPGEPMSLADLVCYATEHGYISDNS